MTGIYLFFVAALWFSVASALSYVVTLRIKDVILRFVVALVVIAVLLPLPLIDEVLGKQQFERLCRDNSTIQVDRRTALGKTVYFVAQPGIEIKGTWVRIVLQPHRFIDSTQGDLVANYNTLVAEGGMLIRTLGISEGGMPLIFRGSCAPSENPKTLFRSLEITALDRPKSNTNRE